MDLLQSFCWCLVNLVSSFQCSFPKLFPPLRDTAFFKNKIIHPSTPAGSDWSGCDRWLKLDRRRLCWLHSQGVERHAEETPQGQVCGRYSNQQWLEHVMLPSDFQERNSNVLLSSAWRPKPDWQGVWWRAGEDHGWEDSQWVKDPPWTQWPSVWHQFQSRQVEIISSFLCTGTLLFYYRQKTSLKYVDIYWMDT